MTIITINGVRLAFWLETTPDGQAKVLWVKKNNGISAALDPEKYKVVGFGIDGTCWRYPGLPIGWGFQLTKDRKIREIE